MNTKIICTIGPASWDEQTMQELIDAGMNVARINGAFADEAELERNENMVRNMSDNVGLLLDVKGTEVRLNKFEEDFEVNTGEVIEIGNSEQYAIYPRTYPELINDLEIGQEILFDDGNVQGILDAKEGEVMKIRITDGGTFKSGKSINVPNAHLHNPVLTDTDLQQIEYAKAHGWEFVAASFIRTQEEAEYVKSKLRGSNTQLIAKIENAEGVENIDGILEIVDGIMIARGDMGVEMPFEKIPFVQKELIYKCNVKAKPVIVATQMLESMVTNERPTRAEITDVANAIIDGADSVMLSAETASGAHPVLAVQTMKKIATEVESEMDSQEIDVNTGSALANSLVRASYELLEEMGPSVTKVVTVSGSITRALASNRVNQEIIPFIESETYRRQLTSLTYGVHTAFVLSETYTDRDHALKTVMQTLVENEAINENEQVLVVGYALSNPDDFPNLFEVVQCSDYLNGDNS